MLLQRTTDSRQEMNINTGLFLGSLVRSYQIDLVIQQNKWRCVLKCSNIKDRVYGQANADWVKEIAYSSGNAQETALFL